MVDFSTQLIKQATQHEGFTLFPYRKHPTKPLSSPLIRLQD